MDAAGSSNRLRIINPQGSFPGQANAQGSTSLMNMVWVCVNRLRILRLMKLILELP